MFLINWPSVYICHNSRINIESNSYPHTLFIFWNKLGLLYLLICYNRINLIWMTVLLKYTIQYVHLYSAPKACFSGALYTREKKSSHKIFKKQESFKFLFKKHYSFLPALHHRLNHSIPAPHSNSNPLPIFLTIYFRIFQQI